MYTSWTKLLTVLMLCSATTLGACAIDDANTSGGPDEMSDDAVNTTVISDPLTGEDQLLILGPAVADRHERVDRILWPMRADACRRRRVRAQDHSGYQVLSERKWTCGRRYCRAQDPGGDVR